MARILGLPVTDDHLAASDVAPRADQMRAQLGGRAASGDRVGELVQVRTSSLVSLPGVLLAEVDGSALVLTRGSVVRKAPIDRVEALTAAEPLDAPTPLPHGNMGEATDTQPGESAEQNGELAALSRAARRFADLREGQRVQISDAKLGTLQGVLVEKCRFGGLVLRSDDSLVAVGFSKLAPRTAGQRLEGRSETPEQGEQAD